MSNGGIGRMDVDLSRLLTTPDLNLPPSLVTTVCYRHHVLVTCCTITDEIPRTNWTRLLDSVGTLPQPSDARGYKPDFLDWKSRPD